MSRWFITNKGNQPFWLDGHSGFTDYNLLKNSKQGYRVNKVCRESLLEGTSKAQIIP